MTAPEPPVGGLVNRRQASSRAHGRRHVIEWHVQTPDPDCPRSDLHTPCPPGYNAWHDWAGSRSARGSTQSRCPGCGLYHVWSPTRRGAA